jgi:poly(3-hydroxybutyrate) depolymerase
MYCRTTLCLLILIGLTVNAQTINLRGTVSNQAGKPITNAIVTLVRQGLKDTTVSTGAYSIARPVAVELPSLPPATEEISLNNGVLKLSLNRLSPVKVEIFDVKGKLLKKELKQDVLAGVYRLKIAENSRVENVLVIHASIGRHEMTFRYIPLQNGRYSLNSSVESSIPAVGGLSKIAAAVIDTLKTTATNYATKVMTISSYDTTVNITLDTAGAVGPSSGCGKMPTLLKSTPPTRTTKPSGSAIVYNKVTVAGKSRQYILWWPDTYDNTHPYRLIICYHWYSGSASQVFDCTTEGINCYTTQVPFYNMLTIANNTTIFVAPDGLNAGWANTNGQDLVFTDSILAQVKRNFCIDTTRIFACGFSYGGGMSYAIACDRAPVFRAVGVFSGAQLSGCTNGKIPIAYYASHGVDDGTCNISGGRSLRDHFVTVNGCTAQTPPEPTTGQPHICTSYKGCSDGHPVRWCAFIGSNKHDPSPRDPGQSTTWNGQETWNFFTQF